MASSQNSGRMDFQILKLMAVIMMLFGVALILHAGQVLAQSALSHQKSSSEKLAEFQSATTGFVRYVKKLAISPDIISPLTDSYVAKIKEIFGPSSSSTLGCKPNECIKLPQSAGQITIYGNLSQNAKIKFREFLMLTSQFQKDVNQGTSSSNPPNIIGQLVDIYAKNVKDLFNS
jgi:hypothetical protein